MKHLACGAIVELKRITGYRMDAVLANRYASGSLEAEGVRSRGTIQRFKLNSIHGGDGMFRNPERVGRITL